MAELTAEQLQKAETMPLAELRALALKQAEEAAAAPAVEPKKEEPKSKAVAAVPDQREEIDNAAEAAPAEETDEPEVTIYRKEIDNGNGVIEVFEAESLEELVDKIAEGKRNASIKIRELSTQKKVEDARTEQQKKDDEYVIAERLKKEPRKALEEIVNEVIEKRHTTAQTAADRSEAAQSRFVATHPDFIPNPENGKRIAKEVQLLGYAEFTDEGLEKAYQSLKKSGLLQLKQPEASAATEAERAEAERIAQAAATTTQPRSPKKSSTISVRNHNAAATQVNTQLSEDEAYKMPLEKLRELANQQLAGRAAE